MADPQDSWVIVCESVHDVMALERALKDAGVAVEMVPTPRELTSDCGMALELAAADAGRLDALTAGRDLRYLGVFRHGPQGYERVQPRT